MATFSTNEHYTYFETTRHWSPTSEKYAGGDALITALRCSWKIHGPVFQEDHWQSGARLVTVYHFNLRNDESTMTMPVITNPYVRRLLRMLDVQIVPFDARETIRRRERRD